MSRDRILAVALVLVSTAACTASFEGVSVAPPGRQARLETEAGFFHPSHHVVLSRGVTLAITCTDEGLPCRRAEASIDDPRVAAVRPAHLHRLQRDGLGAATSTATAFVVTGLAPGRSTIRVSTAGHDGTIDVRVVDDGRPAQRAAAPVLPVTGHTARQTARSMGARRE
jgi:hypothetical protein